MLVTILLSSAPALAVPPTLILDVFGTPVPGEPIRLRFWGLAPGDVGGLVGGDAVVAGATCPAALPFCLDVANGHLVGSGTADAAGAMEVQVLVPVSAAVGSTAAYQGVEPATSEVSPAFGYRVSDHVDVFGVWDDPSGATSQLEIDDQGLLDDIRATDLSDFDNTADMGFSTWIGPNNHAYWERLDWTSSGGSTWLCRSLQQVSEQQVRMLGPADRTSPSTGGCHGGPWTELSPAAPEIAGPWTDPQGHAVVVDASAFSVGGATWTTSRFSNRERTMIGRADPGSPVAGRWARLDWTVDRSGGVLVCPTTVAAATEWQARSTPAADPTDLARGCRGGSWTTLR
ncbi:MAG: hypothetical protein H6738_03405 [Alphaproteobacteria bacterium]|nr:hypothetical protein [Alphaproteobacteria bacterium]MCB9695814.1 hypothetical protein [Alphaproteobacteria bacterium]